MATRIARTLLVLASVAILVASFVDTPVAVVTAVVAVGLFPCAIFLLVEPGVLPGWIALLGLSMTLGLFVAGYWRDSPYVFGLPAATWCCWIFLAALPFALAAYGVVLRRVER